MTKKSIITKLFFALLLFGGYFSFWNYRANNVKQEIGSFLEASKYISYKSIKSKGFPLKAKIVIDNVIFKEDTKNETILTQGYTKIEQIDIVAKSIFGKTYNINIKGDIAMIQPNQPETTDSLEKAQNTLYIKYNNPPKITFSLNRNSLIKDLKYKDNGYKITTSDNKTIFEQKFASMELESKVKDNETRYNFISDFNNMRYLNAIEPENYNVNADIMLTVPLSKDSQAFLELQNLSIASKYLNVFIKGNTGFKNYKTQGSVDIKSINSFLKTILNSDIYDFAKTLIPENAINKEYKKDINIETKDDIVYFNNKVMSRKNLFELILTEESEILNETE